MLDQSSACAYVGAYSKKKPNGIYMMPMDLSKVEFRKILLTALDASQERRIDQAFSAFHNYSVLNMVFAMIQLDEIAPIATQSQWNKKGRTIMENVSPITLVVPTVLPILTSWGAPFFDQAGYPLTKLQGFHYEAKWFSLAQTEGETIDWSYESEMTGVWNKEKALRHLNIKLVRFSHISGNTQAYARINKENNEREVAVNPLATFPESALFHELAHHVLGHLDHDNEKEPHVTRLDPYSEKEVEAETVSYLCCACLGFPGLAESRGYIYHYLNDGQLDDKMAQKIFSAANKIIKAGT